MTNPNHLPKKSDSNHEYEYQSKIIEFESGVWTWALHSCSPRKKIPLEWKIDVKVASREYLRSDEIFFDIWHWIERKNCRSKKWFWVAHSVFGYLVISTVPETSSMQKGPFTKTERTSPYRAQLPSHKFLLDLPVYSEIY